MWFVLWYLLPTPKVILSALPHTWCSGIRSSPCLFSSSTVMFNDYVRKPCPPSVVLIWGDFDVWSSLIIFYFLVVILGNTTSIAIAATGHHKLTKQPTTMNDQLKSPAVSKPRHAAPDPICCLCLHLALQFFFVLKNFCLASFDPFLFL